MVSIFLFKLGYSSWSGLEAERVRISDYESWILRFRVHGFEI